MTHLEQYAAVVIDYTSKYNNLMTYSYSPENVIGKPVKYPAYGDFTDTYMPRTYGIWWNGREVAQRPYRPQDLSDIEAEDYLTLRFEVAVIPYSIIIYETFNPGAIVRIWGRLVNQKWTILWEGRPERQPPTSRKFCPKIRAIKSLINEIRLDFNFGHLNYFTAIDGVLLSGRRPKTELQMNLLKSGLLDVLPFKENNEFKNKSMGDCIKIEKSLFCRLPYEIIVHIFDYLDLMSLSRCAQVSKYWCNVAKDSAIYRNLSLKKYWNTVDDDLLIFFAGRCKNLKKLDLSWCGNEETVTEEIFTWLLENSCKQLTHLSLCHCEFVRERSIEKISHLKDLTELRLNDAHPQSHKFADLAVLRSLVTLDLSSSSIIDEPLIAILRNNPHLKHLNLDLCEHLKHLDRVAETVAAHNHHLVTWSSWKTCAMTQAGVCHLARCARMRDLDLGWCLMSEDPELCLERIAQCKDLRRLILSVWRNMNDHNLLPVLRSCKQLVQLDLMGIRNISGDICDRALASLPKLRLLDVSFCEGIKPEKVIGWRVEYPYVQIQRSCESM